MSTSALSFRNVFPPPQYLKMAAAGVEITDEAVRFVALEQTRHGYRIDAFGEEVIPEGAVNAGNIAEPEKVRNVIEEVSRQFDTSFVSVVLPEERAYVVRLKIPHMKQSEIRGSLELQFEEQIPIPVSEAVFDYTVTHTGEEEMEVMLSAFPREEIEQYQRIFERVSITPIAFVVAPEAVARAVIPPGDGGTYLVVNFGRTKTGFSIISNGAVRFTASVSVGTNALITRIQENVGVTRARALQALREEEYAGEEEDSQFFTNALPTFAALRDEINKHYMYWHSHEDQYGETHPEIEKIILCGEGGSMSGLADYLSSGLQVTVEHANIVRALTSEKEYVPEMEYGDTFKYVAALGSALNCPK